MIIKLGLVILLIRTSICADNESKVEISKCGGCHTIKAECSDVQKAGLYCDNVADLTKIKSFSNPNKTANDGKLAKCVPDYYEVTADITDWCCFWNPAIGCQQLTGTYYQMHSDWYETCELCLHSCDCGTKSHVARHALARVLLLCCTLLGIYMQNYVVTNVVTI